MKDLKKDVLYATTEIYDDFISELFSVNDENIKNESDILLLNI